jgi:hypothetical protein
MQASRPTLWRRARVGIVATCTCIPLTAKAVAPSQEGRIVPCPLFLSVQTAATRALVFIAITDPNADSKNDALGELQPYFDRVLLIPG